jgi:hypothetical protein
MARLPAFIIKDDKTASAKCSITTDDNKTRLLMNHSHLDVGVSTVVWRMEFVVESIDDG